MKQKIIAADLNFKDYFTISNGLVLYLAPPSTCMPKRYHVVIENQPTQVESSWYYVIEKHHIRVRISEDPHPPLSVSISTLAETSWHPRQLLNSQRGFEETVGIVGLEDILLEFCGVCLMHLCLCGSLNLLPVWAGSYCSVH